MMVYTLHLSGGATQGVYKFHFGVDTDSTLVLETSLMEVKEPVEYSRLEWTLSVIAGT